MMSGKAQLTDAVRAVKLGAFQFLEKPLTPEAVLVTVRAALELDRTRAQNRALQAELARRANLIGDSPRDAAGAGADRAGRPDRGARADHRRVGHRQGAGGRGGPRGEPPGQPRVRHRELRGDPPRPGRVGDVRPRARRLHRRHRAAARPLRAGARGHAVPRRDRRPERRGAGQAAPHAGDGRAAAHRRGDVAPDRRPHRVGHQPAAGGRGRGRQLPGGPLLPAERLSRSTLPPLRERLEDLPALVDPPGRAGTAAARPRPSPRRRSTR